MMRKSGKMLAHVSKLALLVNFLPVLSNNYALVGKGHESQPGQKIRNVAMLVWDGAVLQYEYWKPASARGETFTGTLMPVKCNDDDPVSHTRECALDPDCVATGLGLLLADETFLEFDKAGSEKALAALKASAKKSDLKARVVGVRNGLSLNVESVEIL